VSSPLRVVELAQASDTGLVRGHNEDRFTAAPPLLAVADGMGGAQAGEVAASVAVQSLEALAADVNADDLQAAIEAANREIRSMAEANPAQAGMGTTLTAMLLRDGRAKIVHVGDSRAYLLRGGELRRLTEDHSLVNELVRRGELAPEDAERHPHRNVITRALGAEPVVEVDRVEVELADGDVLLLCTDGLTAYVPESVVRETVATAPGLQDAADALIGRANAAGGPDNTTVVLARMGCDGPQGSRAVETTLAMPAVGDTAEIPAVQRAAERPIRSVRVPESPRPAPPARVLQRVSKRHSRRGPIIAVVTAVLLLLAGGVAWAASRTYVVEVAPDGTLRVAHGFPWSPLGIDLSRPWQSTGVQAAPVRAAEPGALAREARGQGEAVEIAVRLVWRYGMPTVTPLAPPPPSTRTARAPRRSPDA
jgi:protein phosphatase